MDIQKQRKHLEELRREYKLNLDHVRSRNREHPESEELPTDVELPTDNADVGTDLFEREQALSFEEDFQAIIDQIDRALAKIKEGTYGKCDRCGRQIPEARLEALPYAVLCIDDQQLMERL